MADIFDTLINDGRFATLVEAIERASLFQGLKEPGTITLFAPTDEAFSKLPSGAVGYLLDNPPELDQVLTYHIIADRKVASSDIGGLNSVNTVEGSTLEINTSNGVRINDASVIDSDIEADNGVIHAIDQVLVPRLITPLLAAR